MTYATARRRDSNLEANRLYAEDRSVHEWYRFVLSFPPHLVRDYLDRFELKPGQCVLDPFCGTGTTLVEAKKRGIASVGVEYNPMAAFASRVKTDWRPSPDELIAHATGVAESTCRELASGGVSDEPETPLFGRNRHDQLLSLSAQQTRLLLTESISPLPLHKTLVLLRHLGPSADERYDPHERLALAKALVYSSSNLRFGPEVGVGPAKEDAAVVRPWLTNIHAMADDLREIGDRQRVPSVVHTADARELMMVLEPRSVDAVITSPPYPNEKDYTRTTRLESVLLGFFTDMKQLREFKKGLVRSNTRSVYKADTDDALVASHPEIQRIAHEIEARRVAMGKTSGFERLYARVTKLYFGGMARHLDALRTILRPGAHLAYVVGDQASYLRVMIRTGQLLAHLAKSLGYEVVGIDLFRTRLATATREQLREEVVMLRWPGHAGEWPRNSSTVTRN
jgi:DNA methylase